MTTLDSGYDPARVEAEWNRRWEEADAFRADAESERPPFTIVIPPPNVTGSLHMGHALGNTLQDILIRHRRMLGYEALWVPGTDHAGIATQTVVERQLRREGTSREAIGRDAFVERVWAWREEYGARITTQLRRLGLSVDWSRERFTLDEGLSNAVREVFVRLYEAGLIYRDDRLVNWDPASQTVLSDLEVEQEEEDGHLWHIAYPVADSDEKIVVATTRPETLLGDTAIAIHPDDPRYTHLHGREAVVPLVGRRIPIVCDPEAADMNFGSGAVKITPAHDFNDFETGRRNALPSIQVIGLDARMSDAAPEAYRGLTTDEARTRVLDDLRAENLLVREEAHRLARGRSQRSGAIIEPLSIGPQWFVRMESLAEPALEAVRSGDIRLLPDQWKNTYYHWMENIRDWCISRQLWWGHRIPAWTCASCGALHVARSAPGACDQCGATELRQDEDVLDTWFSSALWPFSSLGWPEDTPDLRKFYPTDVLVTGFDILFFWVARMIFSGLHFMEERPFRDVVLTAMVRDRHGRKMSKSVGNVIDPLHLIDGVHRDDLAPEEQEIYEQLLADFPEGIDPQGADALRFTLAIYAAAGRDIKLDVKRVEGYRAFLNKLWNATRFALLHTGDLRGPAAPPTDVFPNDAWILDRLRHCALQVDEALAAYRFNEAAQALYDFVWHELCDWYVELAKPVLHGDHGDAPREAARQTLRFVLDRTLRLLHPVVPFISEELWAALHLGERPEDLLATTPWPEAAALPAHPETARDVALSLDVITAIRRVRGESRIPPGTRLPELLLLCADPATRAALQTAEASILRLVKGDALRILDPSEASRPEHAATTLSGAVEIIIPLEGVIDLDDEARRMQKELDALEADITFFEKKLSNPKFVDRAPAQVVDKDRARLAELVEGRTRLIEGLARLAGG